MEVVALNNDIANVFGKNLLKERQKKKLSQRAFAELCSMTNGDISKMENGKVNVTLKTVAHLANALEIPYYTLLKP